MLKLRDLLNECENCGRDWNHGHDHEASMAHGEIKDAISNASKIQNIIGDNDNLPGWVSSYITLASDYLHSVAEYMAGQSEETSQPGPGFNIGEARGDKGRQHSAKSRDYGLPYTPKTDYRVGEKFHHGTYGTGQIIKVEPTAPKDQALEGEATIFVRFVIKDEHGNNVIKNVRLVAKVIKPEMRENKKPSVGFTAMNESIDMKKIQRADNSIDNLMNNISTNSNIPTQDKVGILKALEEIQEFIGEVGYDYEMEDSIYETKKPSAGLSKAKKSALVKKAKAGKDIGKKGPGFAKVEKAAEKKYGSKEAGQKVAAAAMWKNVKR
jgi:hypothetical protein